MLITPRNRTDRVFRALYIGTVIVLALIVVFGALFGTMAGALEKPSPDIWGVAALFIMLTLIFAGQPFYAILLVLSVWWLFRFPEHRLKFGIITAILVPWIVWSLHKAVTMPFP